MTTTTPRHAKPTPTPTGGRPPAMPLGGLLAPATAALATIGAATSLTGVIAGAAWLGYLVVATVLVTCTGLALRSLRVPAPLVPLAQLVVLLLLVTGAFTSSGILAIIPGPAAFAELDAVLTAAFADIRTGVPPVAGTVPILCLVTIAIGLVAVVVDLLAVAASAPAATGLILLCVYAVPSALADELLPWWTFVLGATAFAGLLAVDGSHRHRRWRNRSAPGTGPTPAASSAPVTVVAGALAAGLLAGSAITAIGTEGSLPGSGTGGRSVPGGLGVNPFTSLRGMLEQGADVELFRVTGLGDDQRLLRAFTLDTYRPNEGWGLPDGPMPAGVPARGALPTAPGDDGTGTEREIRIEPVHWNDVWLPVYGIPRALRNVSDGWYYDRTSGAVFRERRQRPGPYVEVALLREPTEAELRRAEIDLDDVPPVYLDEVAVDPRVSALAHRLTRDEDSTFDKVEAVWRHFGPENGFVYDTETAPASDRDALADFLLNGRRGYCEQYASAMAVMLRELDIPARVAVGFTSGYRNGEVRTITSRDAHAWVEVYFGDDLGWVSFDPTPLSDGRGYIPPYLRDEAGTAEPTNAQEADTPTTSATERSSESAVADAQNARGTPEPRGGSGSWLGWSGLLIGLGALALTVAGSLAARRRRTTGEAPGGMSWLPVVAGASWLAATVLLAWWVHWSVALSLAVVALLVAAPSGVRYVQRARRLRAVTNGRAGAAGAAWQELLQESADRGVDIPATDTVRLAAQKVAQRHRLDEPGKDALRTVVTTLERAWYSPRGATEDGGGDATLPRAFRAVLAGLNRTAPLSWRARLLPRSLLRRKTR